MVRKSTNPDGTISPRRLASAIDSYGTTIPELFRDNPAALEGIEQVKQISLLLSRGRDVTSGSQTAYVGGLFATIFTALGAAISQPEKIPEILALLGTLGVGAKALTTKTGREFLTRGFPKVGQKFGRGAQVAAQLGLQKLSTEETR